MIVYGDPSFEAPATLLRDRVAQALERASVGGTLDDARFALIACGQLEQAAADAGLPSLRLVEQATDAAAAAFTVLLDGDAPGARAMQGRAAANLRRTPLTGEMLRVKQPEGFAFYTLYPEHYLLAARAWLASSGPAPGARVLVVGVRSIGTSLSALVSAALRSSALRPQRITVRPEGHPYERSTKLPGDLPQCDWALVVDEGPGQSGSSLASVVIAVRAAGLAPHRIALLPGHPGEPGQAASDEVRAAWHSTPRHSASLDEVRWSGRDLREELAEATRELTGAQVMTMRDLGAGAWRLEVFGPDSNAWPAASPLFEPAKYLARLDDGRRILWKFHGLGLAPDLSGSTSDLACARLQALADRGWTPAPIGQHLGFVALPWLDGDRASPIDAKVVGRYIVEAARGPLSAAEISAGFERSAEMLYWNSREALGEAGSAAAASLARAARARLDGLDRRAAGDGRLERHEWLHAPDGRVLKLDAAGHDHDHTVVGPQPFVWDLAGALTEWDDREAILAGFAAADGQVPEDSLLRFYEAAYSAFRLGMADMTLQVLGSEHPEAPRLAAAKSRFLARLAAVLSPA